MIVIRSGPRRVFRAIEGLRLAVAMLGMDRPPLIVFLDEGVQCLREGVFDDPVMNGYLHASSDLAQITALSDSLKEHGLGDKDLNPGLEIKAIGLDELTEMMAGCESVAAF
ncbi:MAG: DsrE family protein [Candidatus Bathyarchaeota archaeon]|nr:MAG: DsrE family protein [Candidatus Bathyarchaeota archaeon]